ncbi:Mu transposase domain-containing protein [Streptomyces hygroscopicus]|uniref:Mu transposase domain-containing protein n=1 Tax=Streptomyces hygroscopicus TaxID=1912 RepID=UPI0007841010|nr:MULTISPECIES: hypothetical protein [Streptomyces]
MDKLAVRMDERRRTVDGARVTVAELADAEPLPELPALPFAAELVVEGTVTPQGLVAFEGNFYSVPPGLPGARVGVIHRLGEDTVSIATASRAVIARHRLAPRGAGQTVSDRAPCKSKVRRPPSEAALAEAERLREQRASGSTAERVVIDLSHYAAVADRLRHVPPPKEEENEE